MWLWMTLGSAILLGVYDVAKKQSLKRNGVLSVLLGATVLSALFLCPFLEKGTLHDHLTMFFKGILVTTSWISGLAALKTLPITTASTLKASRPVIVVAFSLILFGERLNLWQWGGVVTVIFALWMLSRSSNREGIDFKHSKGVLLMVLSIVSGAASALYDKHIMAGMQPLFVQSWANVYISADLAICLLVSKLAYRKNFQPFRWDWTIVLIAVLITCADALYFFALKEEDALLSVISLIRRSSVIITFALGAWIFKEHNIRDKAISLAVMVAGLVLLFVGSSIA